MEGLFCGQCYDMWVQCPWKVGLERMFCALGGGGVFWSGSKLRVSPLSEEWVKLGVAWWGKGGGLGLLCLKGCILA